MEWAPVAFRLVAPATSGPQDPSWRELPGTSCAILFPELKGKKVFHPQGQAGGSNKPLPISAGRPHKSFDGDFGKKAVMGGGINHGQEARQREQHQPCCITQRLDQAPCSGQMDPGLERSKPRIPSSPASAAPALRR